MRYMLVGHKVTNFSKWERVFDSHAAVQRKSGLRTKKIFRNLDDPSEVILLFVVTDLKKARGFVSSPRLPGAKTQSGVVDEPDIYFLF